MQFKEWLLLKESLDQNLEAWLAGMIAHAKPHEKSVLDALARGGQMTLEPPGVSEPYRAHIVDVLREKRAEDPNWLAFSLGYLSAKKFRREDLEMAVDAAKKLISSGEMPKSEIGAKGWMATGRDLKDRVDEFIRDSQRTSNRAQRRLRKAGETAMDDDRLIRLVAEQGRKRLYLVAPMDHDLQKDKERWSAELNARHRILCKYGKGTKWCTANADGSYHSHYKFNNIYIVHLDGKPTYQFVDCRDPDNHQFMDEDDEEVSEMTVGMLNFLSSHANLDCYQIGADGFEDIGDYLSSPPETRKEVDNHDIYKFIMDDIGDPTSVLERLGEDAKKALQIRPEMIERMIKATPRKKELMDFYLDGLEENIYEKGNTAGVILRNYPDRAAAMKRIAPALNRKPGWSYGLMYDFIRSISGKEHPYSAGLPTEESDREMMRLMDEGLEFVPEHALHLAKDKVAVAERLGTKLNGIAGKSEFKHTTQGNRYVSKEGLDKILHKAGKDAERLAEVFLKYYSEIDMDKAKTLINALSPGSFKREVGLERILREKGDALNDEARENLQKAREKGTDWLWRFG